ncbi:MAG: hypothetical protein JWQ49_711 [Edaphobacter sp.]|nr:hypothetical protein [Edaphobacter sp.]
MTSSLLLFFALALPAASADQSNNPHQDVIVWPYGMPPAGIAHKEDFGNHILSISHREKDGRAELHQTKVDVMIVQSGEATLVYGGQVIDPQPTAPNEIQRSGIKGGSRIEVKAGDVIHIPTGIPHQFFLAPGKQITYMLVKSSIRPIKIAENSRSNIAPKHVSNMCLTCLMVRIQ